PKSLVRRLCAEAPLELLELLAHLGRQPVPESGVVLVDLWQLLLPRLWIDLEQLGHRLIGDVQAGPVDPAFARGRNEPDRGLIRLGLALATAEDPGQHPRVLAEAGPQKPAVVVLAEPVDVEDLRQPG